MVSVFFLAALALTNANIVKLEAQVGRMHEMAERRHAYKPPAQWRHDENVLVRSANLRRRERVYEISAVVIGAVAALVIIFRTKKSAESRLPLRPENVSFPDMPQHKGQPASEARPEPARETLADILRRRDRDEYDIRDGKGKIGQAKVLSVLRPLLISGWQLVAQNTKVAFEDGTERGDIDFLVRSPSGTGFSIDAKNYNNVMIVYEPGASRLDHKLIYHYRYDRPEHIIVKSLEAADWAHRQPALGFSKNGTMYAVMCFIENENLRVREINAYGLRLVKLSNLQALLEKLEKRSGEGLEVRSITRDFMA